MRTLFWCGCTVAVMAAVAVYFAADHAERHPHSMMGCCVRVAYTAATELNPIIGVGARVGSRACQSVQGVVREHPSCQGSCASHACTVVKETEQPDHPMPVEVIDLSNAASACAESTIKYLRSSFVSPEEMANAVDPTEVCEPPCAADEAMPVSVPPSGIEESEDVPATMPPCDDESVAAPEEIPYPAETGESDPPSCGEAQETTTIEDLIKEQADCTKKSVCDIWAEIFGGGPSEPCTTDEPAVEPGAGEEAESHPGAPPDCQEDPNCHQRYPGCPYMGGCPGSHGCPAMPATPAPEMKPHVKKKKHHETPMTNDSDPSEASEMPQAQYHDRPNDPDLPMQPAVDTMEFRRGDAHQGEFDPKPY